MTNNQVEENLRAGALHSRELMDNMSDGVAVYKAIEDGKDFVFLDHNRAGIRITGKKYEEVIGRRVTDVFPGVEEIGLLAVLRRVWKSGQAEEHATSQYKDERIILWVENYVFRLPGGEVVAIYRDVTEQQIQQERITHLSLLRKTGLAIHRILKTDQDCEQMLQKICETFVAEKGYHSAWIVLLDRKKHYKLAGHAGLIKNFIPLEQEMREGKLPPCIDSILLSRQIFWETSQQSLCVGCPLMNGYPDAGIMVAPLQHGDQFYGALTVSLDADMVMDDAERELFEDMAGDIAFTLFNRELEVRRKEKEDQILIRDQISRAFVIHRDSRLYQEVLDIVLTAMNSRLGVFGYMEGPDMLICPSLTTSVWDQCQMADKTISFPREKWAGIWRKTVETGETKYSNIPFTLPEGHVAIDNSMSTAITFGADVIGLLQVANKENGYDRQDKIILESIATTIAPILHAKLQQQKAEQEREKALGEYATLYDTVPDMLVSVDAASKEIVQCNQALLDALGYGRDEMLGRLVYEFYHPDYRERGENEVLPTWQRTGKVSNQEMVLQRKDGSSLPVTIDISAVRDKENNVIQSSTVMHDISDRKKMEEQMIINEKMTTIAGLAAGVAHEINTPLSGIMQSIQLIDMGFDPTDKQNRDLAAECGLDLSTLQGYLQKKELDFFLRGIRESAESAAHIIDSLHQFSRPNVSEAITINIHELIDRAIELSKTDYKLKKMFNIQNVEFIRDYNNDLSFVQCMPMEIEQVLINLIRNSCQAMAEDANLATPQIIVRTAEHDGFVVIEVEDNGPGIEEQMKNKVFDPFFTTKDIGEGTGLGLSVSYSIICDKHGGTIKAENSSGQGAVFTIELPVQGKGSGGHG